MGRLYVNNRYSKYIFVEGESYSIVWLLGGSMLGIHALSEPKGEVSEFTLLNTYRVPGEFTCDEAQEYLKMLELLEE